MDDFLWVVLSSLGCLVGLYPGMERRRYVVSLAVLASLVWGSVEHLAWYLSVGCARVAARTLSRSHRYRFREVAFLSVL